ncbi:MAG: Gfo/Idh/MocA family protein [Armatimonadota bacterium]
MTSVAVAVIGVGAPWHHLPALACLPEVSIVGLCDIDRARLQEAATTYGVDAIFTDYREMLDRVAPQAVYVLPSVLRTVDVATHCLQRGVHVFVEKPPGISAEQTRALARLARERGVISMVGFNRRFHPLVTAARERIGRLRRPSMIVAEWYKPLLMEDMGRTFPPGVLERLLTVTTIHSVDVLRFLGGEVEEILSVTGRFYSPYVDAVHALLRFRAGGVGVLLSEYHTTKVERLQIHAEGVLVELNGTGAPYREGRIFDAGGWQALTVPADERTDPDGFFEEDRHFIGCVTAGRSVTPQGSDLDDAVRTMELAEAIAAAARSGWEGRQ